MTRRALLSRIDMILGEVCADLEIARAAQMQAQKRMEAIMRALEETNHAGNRVQGAGPARASK